MSIKTVRECDGCHKQVEQGFLEIKEGLVRLNNGAYGAKPHTIGYGESEVKDIIACSYDCLTLILQRLCSNSFCHWNDYFPIGKAAPNIKDPNNLNAKQ